MIGHIGVHRANHRDVIDALRGMGEDFADFDSALAVLLKLERRRKSRARLAFRAQIRRWKRFSGVFVERRFGIERVHMGRSAIHEKVNDALGFGGKLWCFGREWRSGSRARPCGRLQQARRLHDGCEAQRAHAHPAAAKKVSAR